MATVMSASREKANLVRPSECRLVAKLEVAITQCDVCC